MSRLEQLQSFLKEQPKDEFLRYAIAQEHFKLGDLDKTMEIYTKLINDSPNYSATYYHLGKLHEKNNQNEAAIEIYKKGISITEKNKELHALSELKSALMELELDDLI